MKKGIALLLALCLLLTLAACGGTAGSDDPAGSAPTENQPQTSGPATITVVDHADHTVTLPADVQRIAVCDIYPLPSVLTIFFDSAEKIVGMAPPSMSAAKNSLLSELYPEILHAETSKSGQLLPFRNGAFKIAQRAKRPVVVSVLENSRAIYHNLFRRRTRVRVRILGVVPTEDVATLRTVQIGDRAHAMIAAALQADGA